MAAIGQGMLVLAGIEKNDSFDDSAWAANKLTKLKLWEGPEYKPWQKSAIDNQHEILLVSQVCLSVCICIVSADHNLYHPLVFKFLVFVLAFATLCTHVSTCVQFTLHARFKANRPSFLNSMPPALASELFDDLVCRTQAQVCRHVSIHTRTRNKRADNASLII